MAKFAVTVRVVALGVIILVLLVPLALIGGITTERAKRRETVFQEVAAVWGGSQLVSGPVLSVPFTVGEGEADGRVRHLARVLRVLAHRATIDVKLEPEIRRRGIFEAPVYTARLLISGEFAVPAAGAFGPNVESVSWQEARLSVGLRDLRGVASQPSFAWAGKPLEVEPGGADMPAASLSARVPAPADAPSDGLVPFTVALDVRGGRSLMIAPLAGAASVSMVSAWPSPGFGGARLPDRYQINRDGFTAEWKSSAFGRNLPKAWTDGELPLQAVQERIDRQAFGVTLTTPVDVYQQAERSTKYGVLFIALTFLTFFLVETLYGATVHPVQYLMIGAALCLFYLLLLALSEHIGFTPAYLLAAGSTIALIGGYARAALGARRSALAITIMLVALYGCLYVLLQLEDYALMMGSIFLFAVLAAVMFVTRRVNWYEVGSTRPGAQTPGA